MCEKHVQNVLRNVLFVQECHHKNKKNPPAAGINYYYARTSTVETINRIYMGNSVKFASPELSVLRDVYVPLETHHCLNNLARIPQAPKAAAFTCEMSRSTLPFSENKELAALG